jgi:hypothetical protein
MGLQKTCEVHGGGRTCSATAHPRRPRGGPALGGVLDLHLGKDAAAVSDSLSGLKLLTPKRDRQAVMNPLGRLL